MKTTNFFLTYISDFPLAVLAATLPKRKRLKRTNLLLTYKTYNTDFSLAVLFFCYSYHVFVEQSS